MCTGRAVLLSLALILIPAISATYVLKDIYVGDDFFNDWVWETMDDPTHGRVNFVDQASAKNKNLSYASYDKFVMRADEWSMVPPSSRGRDSVRIVSNKAYGESVTVLDLAHMPEGCSTWAAFWSLSQKGPWPLGGEIDIVEGVNLDTRNLASLHTAPSCSMTQQRFQSGTPTSLNCDASVNFNQGCGVSFNKSASYGAPFNANGGGWYVMARTQEDVRVWFWSRWDDSVPYEVKTYYDREPFQPISTITPDPSWGPPEAMFPTGNTCEYDMHFDPHQFVFDLTFCGDWAGSAYSTSGCGGSCNDYVDNTPRAFANAFWEINSLRIYTPLGSSSRSFS